MITIFNQRIPLWILIIGITVLGIVVALSIRNNVRLNDAETDIELPRPTLTHASPTMTPTLRSSPIPNRPTTVLPERPPKPDEPLVPPLKAPDIVDLSPTPTSNPTIVPTPTGAPLPPVAAKIDGIRFAVSQEHALEELSEPSTVPPRFRPGERVYTAIQIEGGSPGTIINRAWYLNGTQIGEGQSILTEQNEIIQGNVGERWGMPGGNYELVVSEGDTFLKSASFVVDNTEARVTRIAFTREVDAMGLPLEDLRVFPATSRKILVSFQAFNIPSEAVFKIERVINGTLEPLEDFVWPSEFDSGPGAFQIVVLSMTKPDQKLEDGEHRFRIKYSGSELIAETIIVGVSDNQ